jgi:hypothetical protein
MRTFLLGVAMLAGCSTRAADPPPSPERVSVPGTSRAVRAPASHTRQAALAPDEGTFEIIPPASASIGRPTTARIRIVPGKGFHINTRYPFIVSITNDAGVTVAKTRREDAAPLGERELSIPITLTPTTSGQHTLTGSITFGICKNDSCLQREMPISVAVLAT